eukprot:9503823-Pyramimonas_sp.AAC.2
MGRGCSAAGVHLPHACSTEAEGLYMVGLTHQYDVGPSSAWPECLTGSDGISRRECSTSDAGT